MTSVHPLCLVAVPRGHPQTRLSHQASPDVDREYWLRLTWEGGPVLSLPRLGWGAEAWGEELQAPPPGGCGCG